METKTFELYIVPKFYWLVIILFPVFIFAGLLGLKMDEYLRLNTPLNVWIIFLLRGLLIYVAFKILEHFTYPQCLITVNLNAINISITKAGIGFKKEEIQYNWEELISFERIVTKNGKASLNLIFVDKRNIYFKDSEAFYGYLCANFADKKV